MEMRDVGNEVIVSSGEYEVTSYSLSGPAHSNETVEIDESIRGLCVGYVHKLYNIAVRNSFGTHTIIIVPNEDVITEKDMRSQEDAAMGAEYHATQLVDALQDADAPRHMIESAELMQGSASELREKRS